MTPIEQLRKDHELIRSKLELLEIAVRMGPEACFAIREFAYSLRVLLTAHEDREEEELFDVLHVMLDDPTDDCIQSVAHQHHDHKTMMQQLHRLTLVGSDMPIEQVACMVRRLARVLRVHMGREEQVLFPFLDEQQELPRADTETQNRVWKYFSEQPKYRAHEHTNRQ